MGLFRSACAPVERIFHLDHVLLVLLIRIALEMETMLPAPPVDQDNSLHLLALHHQIFSVRLVQ